MPAGSGAGLYNQGFLIYIPDMHRLLAALLLILAVTAVRAEVIDIDNAGLERLATAGALIIDIRTRPEWEDTGVIKGSRLLTFFDESGRYDAPAWLQRVKALRQGQQPVVVICRSGNRTRPVSRLLSEQPGFGTVYNVRNGIRAWQEEGKPLVPAAPVLAACRADHTC